MKNTIVAAWFYLGTHPAGKDSARKGSFELARMAHDYWKSEAQENDSLVQKIAPSKAGVKAEKSEFGEARAFRITNTEKLRAKMEAEYPEIYAQ